MEKYGKKATEKIEKTRHSMEGWVSTAVRLPADHAYKLVVVQGPELEYGYRIARYNTSFRSWELPEEENLSPSLSVQGWMDLPDLSRT